MTVTVLPHIGGTRAHRLYASTAYPLASPAVYAQIGAITDISGPNRSRDAIDTTNIDITDEYKTFLPGLRDGGEVTFTIMYSPDETSHGETTPGILYIFNNVDTLWPFKIAFADPSTKAVTFNAFPTKFDPQAKLGDKLIANVTLRISGKPTVA